MKASTDLILSLKTWLGWRSPSAYQAEPFGIDVSGHLPGQTWSNNGPVNWQELALQGVTFAYIRASVGNAGDVEYLTNSLAAIGRVPFGAYHAQVPTVTAVTQFDAFRQRTGGKFGQLPPCLDIERRDGCTNAAIAANARDLLNRIQVASDTTPMIYSSVSKLTELLTVDGKPPTWVNNYWLWLAQYLFANPITGYAEEHPGPLKLPSWIDPSRVLIHQTAGKGRGKGRYAVESLNLDFNRWLPGLAHLVAFTKGTYQPPKTLEQRVLELETWRDNHDSDS